MSENEEKFMTRQEFMDRIIGKAQSDQEFKNALVDNPKEALGQLGIQVSEEVEIKVVEEPPGVLYLVLPANPDELVDEQLDKVAAGFCYIDWFICIGKCDAFKPCDPYTF
ncbi:MAG: NHLP leader peptide family RiPP precursor [Peptococcaceae bacterium]|nr:NHLP leader peptide family RiPP precursor [Peptococcaceae bacterium]